MASERREASRKRCKPESATFLLVAKILLSSLAGAQCAASSPSGAPGCATAAARPAAPVITPGTGSYLTAQAVAVTDSTAGAAIYYTTDGSLPGASSAIYTGPISIKQSTMLRAVAIVPGAPLSQISTAVLNFQQMWPLVAFGDSVVEGHIGSSIDYENQLTLITGQPSFNNGIAGQTSGQIAVRMNAYAGTPLQSVASDLVVPVSGEVEVTFPVGYEPCYKARSGNGIMITLQSQPTVTGYCKDDGTQTYWFTPLAYPAVPVSVAGGTGWVAETGNELYHCVAIEEGQNNFLDPLQVFDDIAATVTAVSKTTSCYFIESLLVQNNPDEWKGTANYNEILWINRTLAARYGGRFLDMQSKLVASYDPNNPNDLLSNANGAPPYSLHASDFTGTLINSIPDTVSCSLSATIPDSYFSGSFRSGDIVTIDAEEILIGGGTNGAYACVRGYAGTKAAVHASGTAFTQVEPLHLGQNPSSPDNPYCPNGNICVAEQIYQWMRTYSPRTTAPGSVTSPAAGSLMPGSTVTFRWSPGLAVEKYSLYVGTAGAGSHDVYVSGNATALTATVTNIPAYGAPLYVRLNSRVNGAWQSADYVYTEAGSPVPPTMTSPSPGSVLSGSSATFTWSGGGITAYALTVGTTGFGSTDVYNLAATTATSATVTNIPTRNATLYVRLSYKINGVWQYKTYVYRESKSPSS
jgi:Chitobiase/beta-hexosaminidase C-terminal domain